SSPRSSAARGYLSGVRAGPGIEFGHSACRYVTAGLICGRTLGANRNRVRYAHMNSRRFRRPPARAAVAAAAVLAVSTMAACSSVQPGSAANPTLKVLTFNPFTGQDGSFGPEALAGCQAAAAAINAAGGVLTHTVACQSVDTRGNPASAASGGAKMLVATPHMLGVLGPSSDEADATAPLINAAGIPMFADTGESSFDHN